MSGKNITEYFRTNVHSNVVLQMNIFGTNVRYV